MKKRILTITVLLAVAPLSLIALTQYKNEKNSRSSYVTHLETSNSKQSEGPDFYRRGCLPELFAMRHFLKESTSYQNGTFPNFSSNFSSQQISSMIGRPLTSVELERMQDFSDLGMTMAVAPQFVGQPVLSAGSEDRVIITISGVAPNGLTGYIQGGNLDIDFEIGSPGSSPPIRPQRTK